MLFDLADLASNRTIARALGVTDGAVSNWRQRYDDAPAPVYSRDGTQLWSLAAYLTWAQVRGLGSR